MLMHKVVRVSFRAGHILVAELIGSRMQALHDVLR